MALDFPANPTNGQTYTSGSIVWVWDGAKWVMGATGVYAPILNPVFQGDPQAPTPAPSDNDATIATTAFVKTVMPQASSTTPVIAGTAAVGVNPTWARGDHVHPTQWVQITQAAYDALPVKDPAILYVVVG